jgi:hypothetical protein
MPKTPGATLDLTTSMSVCPPLMRSLAMPLVLRDLGLKSQATCPHYHCMARLRGSVTLRPEGQFTR